MKSPKQRLTFTDIVMIELMKLSPNYDQYYDDVDLSLPFVVREAYAADPERFLPRLIAERAKIYCSKKLRLPVNLIQDYEKRVILFFSAIVIGTFACFALLTALGTPSLFFSGEQREASVLAVAILVGSMALPCLIPLLSLGSLIAQRLLGREHAALADLIVWIVQTMREAWALIRHRKIPRPPDHRIGWVALFRRNSYFASATTIFVSNFYFAMIGLAIFGVLFSYLIAREVNYVHESSLSTVDQRITFVQDVGAPVTWVTGVAVPSLSAMEWAGGAHSYDEAQFVREQNGEEIPWSEAEIAAFKRNLESGFRREWSRFLLASVFTYVFFPRLSIAFLSAVCVWWFSWDLIPTDADSRNREMVDHIRGVPSKTDAIQVDDFLEEEQGDPSALSLETGEVQEGRVAQAAIVLDSDSSGSPSRGSVGIAVVGFGLGQKSAESLQELARLDSRLRDYGNLNGAKSQIKFRSDWRDGLASEYSLLVVASLLSVPTSSFGEFLSDIVESSAQRSANGTTDSARIMVALTDGKTTREKLQNDQDLFESRMDQWRGRIISSGVTATSILQYDLNTAAGLEGAKAALLVGDAEMNKLKVAGKTSKAVAIAKRAFKQAYEHSINEPEFDWTKVQGSVSLELSKLYLEENQGLLACLEARDCREATAKAIESLDLPEGIVPGDCKRLAKVVEVFNTLSPEWAIGGALAGIGIGVLGGAAMIASGGIAALPVILPTVVYSLVTGTVGGQLSKTWLDLRSAKGNALESTFSVESVNRAVLPALQATILQIIVWELQGNPETEITKQLREITDALGSPDVTNADEIDRVLDNFAARMAYLRGQN